MVMNKVRETILQNNLIEKGEHIVVGLSGGPDSVCLFHILWRLAKEWDLTLHAVHINHQLRGAAADGDQAFTEGLCTSLEVPCHVFTCDVATLAKEWGVTTEEAGRKIRYQAFEEVRQEILARRKGIPFLDNPAKGVKIAVAQNLNDQVETVLMRVLRGTGIDGLAGIEYMRDNIIIRPLLDVNRMEIEGYCQENDLNPRVDMTNLEPVYTRNKIRLELLPYLEKNFNPGIVKALSRLAKNASEDKSYINGAMPKREVSASGAQCTFLLAALREAHPAVRKRTLIQGFKDIGLTQDITSVHLESAEKLIREKRTSGQMDFPGGYGLRIAYDRVELFRKQEVKEKVPFLCQPIRLQEHLAPEGDLVREEDATWDGKAEWNNDFVSEDGFAIPALDGVLRVRILQADQDIEVQENPSARLAMEALRGRTEELLLRTRRPGDVIVPLGMTGTKKLQDFFVDAKIPKEIRDRLPLVCLGSEVLWIPGQRINENYKVREDSIEILFLEYEGEL